MSEIIVDSQLSLTEAISSSPNNYPPDGVIGSIGLTKVEYYGFDSKTHIGQIVVNKKVISEVKAFFKKAYEIRFPIEKVIPASDKQYLWDDERLMSDNVSSGFNYRVIAGTDKVSLHGLGLAFDINPIQNPYIRYENANKIIQPPNSAWDKDVLGTLYAEHPLVKLMEGFGWEWGGHWTAKKDGKTDYQHFQKPNR